MTSEVIKKIISQSLLYASGDNCQPFVFKVEENGIEIFFHEARAKHELDFMSLASCVSLGTLSCLIAINSEAEGYRSVNSFVFNEANLKPHLKVRFEKSDHPGSNSLQSSITKRRTYRGPFKNLPLAPEFVNQIKGQSNIRIFPEIDKAVARELANFESEFWNNKFGVADLFKLVHFRTNDYHESKTGLFLRELFPRLYEVPLLYLFKHFPSFPSILIPFGGQSIFKKRFLGSLENASLVVFQINESDKGHPKTLLPALFELGRSAMEFWLLATQNGLFLQPLSMSSFSTFFGDDGLCKLAKNQHHFKIQSLSEKSTRLHQACGIEQGKCIGWIFRMGVPIPQELKTLQRIERKRISIQDVLAN